MLRQQWPMAVSYGLVKLAWGVVVVALLASAEPFWHQALIVLGGALITAAATIGSAWMMTRRLERPVDEMSTELREHRNVIEGDHHQENGE